MATDQDHAAMQQSPAEMLSNHPSCVLPPTSLLENSNPVTVQQNSGNTCIAAVVANLLASSPAFSQFLTTVVDRNLILWKGDLVQELQALTTPGSLQVND